MTGRERLLCTLAGEIPDRVPVSFFVQEEYLSWFYPQRERVSRLQEAVDCARHYSFDVTTRQLEYVRPYWTKQSTTSWDINEKTWTRSGVYYRQTTIDTPGGCLKQLEEAPYDPRTISGISFHTREYFLKTPEDFELFRKYMPKYPEGILEERKAAARHARGVIGDSGISAPWGAGGVYNAVSTCRDIQELMMDPFLRPDFYQELMVFFTSWIAKDYEFLLETEHDAVGMQGNIANGSLLGLDFFNEHVLPYETQIIDLIRQGGKFSIYHNCGDARNLYPAYKQLGMDVWETISPAPMGDNDLAEAKMCFGDQLVLSGNLDQVSFLKTAEKTEIEAKVHEMMEIGKPGGHYIFSASDFLERGTPEDNIYWAVEAARECGRY